MKKQTEVTPNSSQSLKGSTLKESLQAKYQILQKNQKISEERKRQVNVYKKLAPHFGIDNRLIMQCFYDKDDNITHENRLYLFLAEVSEHYSSYMSNIHVIKETLDVKRIFSEKLSGTRVWQYFTKHYAANEGVVVCFRLIGVGICFLTADNKLVKPGYTRIFIPMEAPVPNIQILPWDLFISEYGENHECT